MRLSEAILLGSVGTGQAFDVIEDHDGNTCAMGAAMVGCGIGTGHRRSGKWEIMDKMFPILNMDLGMPPGTTYEENDIPILWNAIANLNNIYIWTRPQIAAWVAEQEVKLGIVEQVEAEVKDGEHATA